MKKLILLTATIFFTLYITAQYTIGTQTITYTDASRANRPVGVDFRYPGTNTAVAAGQFPFVIFAHGFSMDQTPYYPYADSLAKRGYIVGLLTTETGISPSHTNFAQDLLFVYNKLISEGTGNNSSPFYQHVIAKGAIGGHSMGGGSTVLSAMYGNPEVCCFTFSAATTNPSSINTAYLMTKPYLSFAGSSDCIAPVATNQQPMYDSSGSACKFLINITGGLHCQYGNANSACSFGEGLSGCASSSLTRQQQIDKTLYHLIPFLDYYLKGDCSAWTLFENRYTANAVDAKQRNCTNTVPSNAFISGPSSFCNGGAAMLLANPIGFQYVWSDNSTSVMLHAYTPGTYSVVVGNGTCSLPPVSVSVTENFLPVTPSAITAPDTVCSNLIGVNISVPNDTSVITYNWTLPSGWSITGGNNTNSIQVSSDTTSGIISVIAQNDCGTTSPVTKAVTVIPLTLGTPGTIGGLAEVCAGTSAQYFIAPVAGASSYTWNSPTGWSVISLNPDTAITYTTGDSNAVISVTAMNECGQSPSSVINVLVHNVPVLGILYGQDTVCLNNPDALNFSLSSADDADSIVWSVTNPWNIIAGQGSSVLNINSYNTNGSVSVYASNECGTTLPLIFNVVYVDTPQITITQQGGILHASSASAGNYQWYADGAFISGATGADYTPTANGNYTVSVINLYGCSSQSSPFSFVYNGLNEILYDAILNIFPSPNTTGNLEIIVTDNLIGGELRLLDAAGGLVFQTKIQYLKSKISAAFLSKGVYIMCVETNQNSLHKKFIIQ